MATRFVVYDLMKRTRLWYPNENIVGFKDILWYNIAELVHVKKGTLSRQNTAN